MNSNSRATNELYLPLSLEAASVHPPLSRELGEENPRTDDSPAERVEFELPVPICEHTDDSIRLSFATSRRLHAQSLLKHRDGAERRGVLRSRLLVHHRGRHNRAELLVTLCVVRSQPYMAPSLVRD
jgi:hypothetical protein